MKSNQSYLLSPILLCFLFASCGDIKDKKYKIDVTVIAPVSSKADTILPEPFITFLAPVSIGDSIVYEPEVIYKRKDLNKEITGKIEVPVSSISEFQKNLGTYTATDYGGDLETAIEEQALLTGVNLSLKSQKNTNEIAINEAEYDIIWVKDSAQILSSNMFSKSDRMKEFILSKLTETNKTTFSVFNKTFRFKISSTKTRTSSYKELKYRKHKSR